MRFAVFILKAQSGSKGFDTSKELNNGSSGKYGTCLKYQEIYDKLSILGRSDYFFIQCQIWGTHEVFPQLIATIHHGIILCGRFFISAVVINRVRKCGLQRFSALHYRLPFTAERKFQKSQTQTD
jgi:hypothetical protein